jgi:hypothetical protein
MASLRKRKTWNEDKVNKAVGAVMRQEIGYFKPSKYCDV